MPDPRSSRIFTFWEPADRMPPYIRLCMKTWSRFLPDHDIVRLSYANLDQWLEKECFDRSLYRNYSLPQQADALRCAVLARHGGIWLDADTVITSGKIRHILDRNTEFTLIGGHIAFLIAPRGNEIVRLWEQGVHDKIRFFKPFGMIRKPFIRRAWDALGNSILDKVLAEREGSFTRLDRNSLRAVPETLYGKERGSVMERYVDFYFASEYSDAVFANEQGIVLLHNSWTPGKYRRMSEERFLRQNNTLARMLARLLGA